MLPYPVQASEKGKRVWFIGEHEASASEPAFSEPLGTTPSALFSNSDKLLPGNFIESVTHLAVHELRQVDRNLHDKIGSKENRL